VSKPVYAPSVRYDHNPSHYRFARVHSGSAPDKIYPVLGWGIEVARAIGVFTFVAAIYVLLVML